MFNLVGLAREDLAVSDPLVVIYLKLLVLFG